MTGRTEAFLDLEKHCQLSDCNQLDFLPFKCDGCQKVFCLEHKSSKSHDCPKAEYNSLKVVVCETCSMAIETTGHPRRRRETHIGEAREIWGLYARYEGEAKCPVKRCREIFTFSNNSTCKICQIKVCIKH